ncbi:MAG TPA: hypothetical protein VI434_13495 [Candidatus Dormibacteraeota bacterium]
MGQQKRRAAARRPESRSLFSPGGPALTQVTAKLIRANLEEIVTAMDDERTEASDGLMEEPPV